MELHLSLIVIGALLLAGLLADAIGRRTRIPRVTLLIVLGMAIGRPGLDLLPAALADWQEPLATAALAMVAFLLGGSLTAASLGRQGREIAAVSLAVVAATAIAVAGGLMLAGVPAPVALILGGIATATDPAATRDVVRQAGGGGAFGTRLLGIVAIDDAWGLIAFGLMFVAATALAGAAAGGLDGAGGLGWMIVRDLGGSILLGAAIGVPAALLTGRLRPGEPMLVEALGVVSICAGAAVWLELSFLLACMVAGAVVANLARHHATPFHEIDNVQAPFLILFFILAGALLDLPEVAGVIGLCAGFAALRVAGRALGGLAGGRLAGLPAREGLWTGAALMPQAGVALGMALVAADRLPAHGEAILAVTVAATVVFEVAGPLATQAALTRFGPAADGGPGGAGRD